MAAALAPIFDEKIYARLLAVSLPRPIRNKEELERTEVALLNMEDHEKLTPEQKELSELMAILIEKYEEEHYPVAGISTPIERLRALMEDRGLKQADIARILGSRSQASDVMNARRQISKAQAKKLAEALRAPLDLFL